MARGRRNTQVRVSPLSGACGRRFGELRVSDQYLAFEALSPGMQRMLSSLRVVLSDASLNGTHLARIIRRKPQGELP